VVESSNDRQIKNEEKLTSTIKKLDENLKYIDVLKTNVKDLNNIRYFFFKYKERDFGRICITLNFNKYFRRKF
jgi:hypothetical protein